MIGRDLSRELHCSASEREVGYSRVLNAVRDEDGDAPHEPAHCANKGEAEPEPALTQTVAAARGDPQS